MGVPSLLAASLALLIANAIADPLSLLQVGLQTSGDLNLKADPTVAPEAAATVKEADPTATPEMAAPAQGPLQPVRDFCGFVPNQQPGMMQVLLHPSGQEFLVELTDAFEHSDTVTVMSTAMSIAGSYRDGSGYRELYGEPLEETHNTLFQFKLSADGTEVEVYAPHMDVRTSDTQMEKALKRGLGSSYLGSFGNLECMSQAMQMPGTESGLVSMSLSASFSVPDPHEQQEDAMMRRPPPMSHFLRVRTNASASGRIVIHGQDLMAQGFMVAPSYRSSHFKLLNAASFPRNIAVSAEIGTSQVGYSMVVLPDEPMVPRVADDRLMYFSTDYKDLGQHMIGERERAVNAVDRDVSVIWRYDLATLPDNQIRIHVDPSVPVRWRKYFREGVEAWNEAYAYAGKPNSVRAVCPEDSDWPADYSVNDARYSTVSWSVSDQVVSMGIAKVDPRSGQIIKSDIIMADGWVKAWLGDLDLLAPNVTYTLDQKSGFHTETRSRSQTAGNTELPFASNPRSDIQLGTSLSLLALGADAQSDEDQENIIGEGLREVVMHETGHILGLRHNFKGSMGVSYECTQDIQCSAKHGLTSSVMDYLPMNLATGSGPVHHFSPKVGAYDKAAIRYGYMDADDKTAMASRTRPADLLSVVVEAEGIQTCYDGDADAQDPSCMRYDATGTPLRYFEEKLTRVAERQRDVLQNAVLPGRSYKNFGNSAHSLLYMAGNTGLDVLAWIGGMNNSHAHRGLDGKNRMIPARQPMPVELQRQALSLFLRVLHPAANGLLPKPEDMKYLVEGRHLDEVASQDLSYDIRHIADVLLHNLLSPKQVVDRLHAQERFALDAGSSSGEAFSVGEFFSTVTSDIFGQGLDKESTDDWNLQEYYTGYLIDLYKMILPSPVKAQILIQIERMDKAVVSALDRLQAQAQLHVAPPSNAAPSSDELLQAHLFGLHSKLFDAVCDSSSKCNILPVLAAKAPSPSTTEMPSGAQATVPAVTALMALAFALRF